MQSTIEKGLCQCGCGGNAPVSDRTHKRYGWIKGQPKRFIKWHNKKKIRKNGDGKGYLYTWIPDHPNVGICKNKPEHLLMVERAIGNVLPIGTVIHHIDGDKSGNRNGNLVACQNHSYHALIHARMRALKECGHANWHKCGYCHKWDSPENLYITPNRKQAYHKTCKNTYQNERKRKIKI